MNEINIGLLAVVLIYCTSGLVDASCGSNCLNSTEDSAGIACNETTGQCLYGCVSGYTGLSCQIQCGENCLNCSTVSTGTGDVTQCDQCDLNYFKNGSSCEPCSDNCVTISSSSEPICNPDTGHCTSGCMKDFYGDYCGMNCSSNCYKNVTSELASCEQDSGKCRNGCINGYHGEQCETACSATCQQNDTINSTLCRQEDGLCESGCLDGWFGGQCTDSCSAGCMSGNMSENATCSQMGGLCDFGCLNKYYGESCDSVCSQNCLYSNTSDRTCNETTGHCEFSCKDGYFDLRCDKPCSTGCALNNTSVSQNDTTELPLCDPLDGSCSFGCDNTSYLSDCSGNCSLHCLHNDTLNIRACNETNGYCEFGCENGYYGLRCENECHSNCLPKTSDQPTCDFLSGSCNYGCQDKYHGSQCTEECDNKCVNSICQRDDGCCLSCRFEHLRGCTCNDDCPEGCAGVGNHCYQNGTCRKGCDVDYWGPTCSECSDSCVDSPDPGTAEKCRIADGFCQYGCKNGIYGPTCSDACPKQCQDNLCDRASGQCLNKCNLGYYGEYCNNSCSQNCRGNDCFPENGTCVAATCLTSEHAWYGYSCELKCPRNCLDKICERYSGNCTNGCVEGYFGGTCNTECLAGTYGKNCDKTCSEGCVNVTCEPRDGKCDCEKPYIGAKCETTEGGPAGVDDKPILSGSVGGAAALLLIIGIVILCVWRHKKKKEFVRRRKPKNRKAFSEVIRQTFFSKSMSGPKRILIDNLLARVKEMNSRGNEMSEDFERDFNDINEKKVTKSDSEARKVENESKNRFVDIYPYNENRVVLHPLQADTGQARYRRTMDVIKELSEISTLEYGYINASFIDGYASAKQRYIAAQIPYASTVNDFWKMVFQEKVSVIVMLTELEEKGLFKQYWPDVGSQTSFGEVNVHCVKQDVFADFSLRRLNVKYLDERRPVQHLQFTSWPSDGPPPTSAGMMEFYHKFLSIEPEKETPTVVHCTSGVGRTGCFIALDLLVDEGNEDHSIDVSQCVMNLREQRVGMVQSENQYEFLYKTVAQVLSLRSYPVNKDNFKKEWKELRKDGGKLIHSTFEDMCESVKLDEMDTYSIVKNQGEDGKNREGSDIPEDRYRPQLANGDYINAVYSDTYKKKHGIIMTQMPTPETVNEFYRLILQEECHVAVMMNSENWDDETQVKYWPSYDKSTKYGDIFVTTTDILDRVSYLAIKLTLSDLTREDDKKFTVNLYQLTVWKAENKCPKNEVAFLSLIREVIKQTGESYPGKILVHCLNGSERSGLFCATYNLLEKLNYEGAVSVVNTVRKIKSRRATAIPNEEQFRFIYECLVYYIENYEDDIKYKPEETVRKRSGASGAMKRISQMYAKPNKKEKRKSNIYAKPDKKKKSTGADDKIELVNGQRTASGSNVQAVYAVVDKRGKKKTDSKVGKILSDEIDKKRQDKQNSEEITVTIEHNSAIETSDVSILVGEKIAERESDPYAEMNVPDK